MKKIARVLKEFLAFSGVQEVIYGTFSHLLHQLYELSFASNLDISSEPCWRDAEPKLAINSMSGRQNQALSRNIKTALGV